jgi:hypothetical protein
LVPKDESAILPLLTFVAGADTLNALRPIGKRPSFCLIKIVIIIIDEARRDGYDGVCCAPRLMFSFKNKQQSWKTKKTLICLVFSLSVPI